jgi:hypothetical protein
MCPETTDMTQVALEGGTAPLSTAPWATAWTPSG